MLKRITPLFLGAALMACGGASKPAEVPEEPTEEEAGLEEPSDEEGGLDTAGLGEEDMSEDVPVE